MKTSASKIKLRLWSAVTFVLPFLSSSTAWADVHLPTLFSEGAVLQRGVPVPVWGTADADEVVTVSLNGKTAKATTDKLGKWTLKLPSLDAGGPFDLTVSGKNTLIIRNVAVGEVWIASGQSNMEFPLQTYAPSDPVYGPKAKEEIAAVNDPLLRMFAVPQKTSPDRAVGNTEELVGAAWKVAIPENAAKFSAIGYHYARELHSKLNVPVGIIQAAWFGTPAEAWTSRSVQEADPKLKVLLNMWDKKVLAYPMDQKTYEEQILPAWKLAIIKAKSEGRPESKKPRGPQGPDFQSRPATLFNAMINPLIPYGIKGVIWYQGEANASVAATYQPLFSGMIKDWRERWGEGDFPFLFVQLANIGAVQQQPVEEGWGLIREAQFQTLATPGTGMASAIDLADSENPNDIHPHNKREVGRRLSLIALATVYGEKIPSYSGPLYSGVKIVGSQAVLSFTNVDGGLVAKGDRLQGFALAGKYGKFVWADAKIEGDTIVVSSEQVPEPAAVRYGWANNPIGNLYNKDGLPASPFRTDRDLTE
jgi:sialate O-acetylesterase